MKRQVKQMFMRGLMMTSHSKEENLCLSTIDFVNAYLCGARYVLEGGRMDIETLTREMAMTFMEQCRIRETFYEAFPSYIDQAVKIMNIIRPLHETNKELS